MREGGSVFTTYSVTRNCLRFVLCVIVCIPCVQMCVYVITSDESGKLIKRLSWQRNFHQPVEETRFSRHDDKKNTAQHTHNRSDKIRIINHLK